LNETAKRWIQPLARNVSEEKESETWTELYVTDKQTNNTLTKICWEGSFKHATARWHVRCWTANGIEEAESLLPLPPPPKTSHSSTSPKKLWRRQKVSTTRITFPNFFFRASFFFPKQKNNFFFKSLKNLFF
jgi:hypothetical protein